jgi:hypothetical protein
MKKTINNNYAALHLVEKEDYKSAYECANAYLSVLTN